VETGIVIAGSGGQGILYMGKALVFACMLEGREVTWFPSYGAEMRGGTANCTVVVSDAMVGSPVVARPDVLIVMNTASLQKFQPALRKGGTLLYDASLVLRPRLRTDIVCLPVPASAMASSAGSTRSANMVMLGALVAGTAIVSAASVLKVFEGQRGRMGGNVSDSNLSLIMKGIRHVEDKKGNHPRP